MGVGGASGLGLGVGSGLGDGLTDSETETVGCTATRGPSTLGSSTDATPSPTSTVISSTAAALSAMGRESHRRITLG